MIDRATRRFSPIVRMLRRIVIAIRWVVYFHWRYNFLRKSLRKSFGSDFVMKSLPPQNSRRLWMASAAVVATAWRPPHHQLVQQRTKRFRKLISVLRRLDDHHTYVVKTPAGTRVYGSAIARCWLAFTGQDVSAEIFLSQQKGNILKTLITWLERSGVERYELLADPKAFSFFRMQEGKPDCGPKIASKSLAIEREIREVEEELHRTEAETSCDLADMELEALMMQNFLRYLALPEAILMAKEQ